MHVLTISEWMEKFRSRFNERELTYMTVHKARIILQLKDKETGEVHFHELDYRSKEAENLTIISAKKEGGKQ